MSDERGGCARCGHPEGWHKPKGTACEPSWSSCDGIYRPRVVVLCGSTRFYDTFQDVNYRETMAGRIVLSVGFYPHAAVLAHGAGVGCTPEQKVALDALHFRKIEMADEVLVLNVGGYVGESTAREVEYARSLGKRIRWLEEERAAAPVARPTTPRDHAGGAEVPIDDPDADGVGYL